MAEKSDDLSTIQSIIMADEDDLLSDYFTNSTNIDQIFPTPFENNRYSLLSELFYNKPSLLCAAAFYGSVKCMTYLIMNGADVEFCDQKGRTPIFYAIASNNLDSIDYLYSNNANITKTDLDGTTILHFLDILLIRQYLSLIHI